MRRVTVEGHSVPEVAKRLGVTTKSLCDWKRVYGKSPERTARIKADQAKNQRFKKVLKRLTEERDIPKHVERKNKLRKRSDVR